MAGGSGYIYKTLPNDLRTKVKCQVLVQLLGETFLRSCGDTTSVVGNRTIEEQEVASNETPDKDIALVDITKNDFGITIAFRQITPFLKKAMFQSEEYIETQDAVSDAELSFEDVALQDILPLEVNNVTNVVVTSGATALVLGTHYNLDAPMGRVQIHAFPSGVGASGSAPIKVAFDAEAVKISTYGLASKTDLRGKMVIRQNNRWGPDFEYTFHDVQFRPDGELNMGQDGDEFGDITITGKCFADSSKPTAFRIGRVQEIPKKAA